jgi:hypothetical protein
VNLANLSEARSDPRHVSAANYFSYYHTRAGFHSIRYALRTSATIAVPVNAFASGEAIAAGTLVRPTAVQWSSARILSHPSIAPTMQSVVPQAVDSVPVPAERAAVVIGFNSGAANALQSGTDESMTQPGNGFYLIARTAPPAAGPTLDQQLPALRQNDGRPLDAAQLANLAAGRMAGAATAKEFPPLNWASTNAAGRSGRAK